MNLDKVNLNLFVALDALLYTRSLTEAAKTLHLSQPALSIALKKLREIYSDEIIVYSAGEEPVLTALGVALKPRVKALIQTAKDALKVTSAWNPDTDQASFRIVAPDVLELLFLKDVLTQIVREAPNVRTMSLPFNYQPVENMLTSDVDLVIAASAFANDQYSSEPLFEETFSCMVWEGNTDVGSEISEEEYLRLSHADLSYTGGPMPTNPAFDHLRRVSVQRKVVLQASVYSSLPHMVVGTNLIVTTLTRYANWCAARLPIRVMPYPFSIPVVQYVAQWQPYRDDDPALGWLRSKLRSKASSIDEPIQASASR